MGQFATSSDIQVNSQDLWNAINGMQSQINNLSTSWGHADNPGSWATSSSDKSKMLTYTEADNLGLPRNAKLGDVEVGTDGVPYRYMTYTPPGNNHWFRP